MKPTDIFVSALMLFGLAVFVLGAVKLRKGSGPSRSSQTSGDRILVDREGVAYLPTRPVQVKAKR